MKKFFLIAGISILSFGLISTQVTAFDHLEALQDDWPDPGTQWGASSSTGGWNQVVRRCGFLWHGTKWVCEAGSNTSCNATECQ